MQDLKNFELYLMKRELSSNTISCYLRDSKVFISWHGKEATELDEFDLLNYKKVLLEKEKTVITVNRKLASVNVYCQYLFEDAKITEEPYHVKLIKNRDKPSYKGAPEEEIRKLKGIIYESDNPMHICIIEMLLGTGIRVSELVGLTMKDITMSEKGNFIRVLGKGMVNRTLAMNPEVIKALVNYLEVRKQSDNKRVFIGQRGAIGRGAVEIIMKNYASQVELDITPHRVRHSVGYQLVKKNTPMTTIQQILGHESILTTNLYTQTTERDKAEALMSLRW